MNGIDKTTDYIQSDTLDLAAIIKSSQIISGEVKLRDLLQKLMKIIIESVGAEKGFLLLQQEEIRFLTLEQLSQQYEKGLITVDGKKSELVIQAESYITKQDPVVLQNIPLEKSKDLSISIVQHVAHNLNSIVLENASKEKLFSGDPYIIQHQPKSILCFPLIQQSKLKGIIYLENNLYTGAFTKDRIKTLKILASQAAISIENARLYNNMENLVAERTEQLNEFLEQLEKKHEELQIAHRKLQDAQAQLVQSEKMASLGTMVAGIAHEINNPVNFIYIHAITMMEDLKKLNDFFNDLLSEEKELSDFSAKQFENFFISLADITNGSERIKTIVQDLKNFSRLDEAEVKSVRVSEGIESTLRIISTQYKNVTFIKEFQDDPEIKCRPAQLNQVFLNIMNNSCYAIETKQKQIGNATPGTLTIKTFVKNSELGISFTDTGIGMNGETIKKMFDPFYTTKSVGKGTGLGMSVSHSIVANHKGRFEVESKTGEGTTVVVWLKINSKA
ncbi:MAG: GAF domain-containing protein [Leptospiraceae bacterium]|nr:GAF domain-containing protein [Leptospiraceae bacterium]MCP5497189.1 GAF domain-containing protein [Leptospiraceae bacterium]